MGEQFRKLERMGEELFEARHELMAKNGDGASVLYNSFHDQSCHSKELNDLRALHSSVNEEVARSYGLEPRAYRLRSRKRTRQSMFSSS